MYYIKEVHNKKNYLVKNEIRLNDQVIKIILPSRPVLSPHLGLVWRIRSELVTVE